MPYTPDQIRDLLSQGEGSRIEYKTRLRDPAVLASLIAAFANTEGGVVLVGVGDKGEVLGASVDETSRTFHLALARVVRAPKVDLEATQVDGKTVVTITVGKGGGLTLSDAGALQRVNDRSAPLETARILKALEADPSTSTALAEMAGAINHLTVEIQNLRKQLEYANSFRGRWQNYLVGGLIGAVLSGIVSLILM